jgi:cation transporter-like permease
MKYFQKIFKESIIIVLVSSLIGLISGSWLSLSDEILYSFPIILLLLPSLNSLIGDISTILISRLTTHLFIGSLQPKIQISDKLKEDFIALLSTVSLSLIFLIILGHGIAIFTGIEIVNPFIIILFIIITIFILFISLFFLLFICAVYLFQRGKDPNNFLIPFTTSLADFLTPLILIILIQIFI